MTAALVGDVRLRRLSPGRSDSEPPTPDRYRSGFDSLLKLVFENKIDTVYITYPDRLSRLSFITIKSIFNKFGTKIIPIHNKDSDDYDEIFDEVSSLMHYFTTKKYSHRKNK